MGCVRDGLLALFLAKESKNHTRHVQNRWRSRNSICMRQEPQERDCQSHPLGTWIAGIWVSRFPKLYKPHSPTAQIACLAILQLLLV